MADCVITTRCKKIALDGLAKFPMQSEFRLFNGIALAMGNRMQECIRELNPLKNEAEMGLAATVALIHAHKNCHVIDRDALQILETRIGDRVSLKNSSNAQSYYYAAVFYYLIDDLKTAMEQIEIVMKIKDNTYDDALILRIWCQLSLSFDQSAAKSKIQNTLEMCIARSNGKNIDASLALVRYYQNTRKFKEALSVIEKLSIRLPEINILLIEKMNLHLAALDWDQSMDTSMRVINLEPYNIAALLTKGVLHIIRESNIKAGATSLQQLLASVDRNEPGNYTLLLEICQLFSRICSRNFDVLQITHLCVEKMNQQNPADVLILTELGYQELLLNKIVNAELTFRLACDVNSRNFEAFCGLTLCKLKAQMNAENRQQIRQQLAFLMKLAEYKPNPLVLYMSALLAETDNIKEQQLSPVQILGEAIELHFRKLESFSFGIDYIRHMNPEFMLDLCKTFIGHTPPLLQKAYFEINLSMGQQSMHITIKDTLNILESILQICPGHQGAMFMRGNIYFICGEYSKAVTQLRSVLNVVGEKYTDAYLLLAQILVEKKQYTKAFEYLELALVHKFTVRDMPMYHLLKGIIYKNQNNILEAHQSFLLAMQLAGGGVKTEIQPLDYSLDKRLTISDKMTLYIELIYILREMPDSQGIYESERILQTAIEEFKGTVEMGRLVIAHSKLKIEKSDISTAIDLLSSIKPDQTYYVQARIQLANIYLQHQKNRCGFAKCFKDLVEIRPEPQNFLMLGEACLSIQETTTAICAYRNAYKMSPSNAVLARELGRAYVKSHHYAKALKYYHEVIQNPDCSALKLDLAELFLKLKHYQNSVNILSETDGHKINDDSLTELQLRTKRLLLLARVHEKSGNVSESLKALDRARDNQVIIQKRCAIDQSESLHEQHKILSNSFSYRQKDTRVRGFSKQHLLLSPADQYIV
ncbi:tetratricopeptide repeat protein 21B-like [Drosophila sulfurigaster albostrigata]|uniref:tetratricopeptide repeat protein 21B-like n=1 Tax=Drosophila sulfurigaster albostrigata TaxID=89887 RepID=UPI002D21E68B|nr:tetratricopeptide repeat protein 21B-like [Drosophila sulfurigaster albostrigata]